MKMKQTPQEANKRTGRKKKTQKPDLVDIVKLLDLTIPEVHITRTFSLKKPKYTPLSFKPILIVFFFQKLKDSYLIILF